jgi:2,4-dienoyl-CoA reductase-like NADH-dependent reductase (Old Yellow Enzyme family)
MSDPFPILRSPVSIGPMRLRNRVVLLPHGLFYASRPRLLPVQRQIDYYRARARGGVALVVTESAVTSADGEQRGPLVMSSDPRCVPGYARMAEAVHAEGALVCGQITHFGNQGEQRVTRRPLAGPSALADPGRREPAARMSSATLARIRDDFATSARHLRTAGFDGVELKASHDGLLRQFLSPLTNDRDDEYGGNAENRVRWLIEVARAVRGEIGPGLGLGVRLVLDEEYPGGYGIEDGVRFVQALHASGVVDYVSAAVGISNASIERAVAPMSVPEGFTADRLGEASKASPLPIIAVGRLHRPEFAESLLAGGQATAIGMARELMADPDWANKALGGTPERIRPCTACNQLCIGNLFELIPVGCTVNPYMGFGEVRKRPRLAKSRVVVVGGGPAGMEAARVASEDGHLVSLLERGTALGGQLALAGRVGGRHGWQEYLDWLERELIRLRVDIQVGTEGTVDSIERLGPDLIIRATGSIPGTAPFDGTISLDEFIGSTAPLGRVALVDCGIAGPPLWTATLEASLRGADTVTVVTPLPSFGADIDMATFRDLYRTLHKRGALFHTDHAPVRREGDRLVTRNVYTGALTEIGVDVVVASTPRVADGAKLQARLELLAPVVAIGDAVAPRDAPAAIREGQAALGSLLSIAR